MTPADSHFVPPAILRPQSRRDALLFAAVDCWAKLRHRSVFSWLRKIEAKTAPNVRRSPSVALPNCTNDKYTWRKLFDRDPLFTRLSDKLESKRFLNELAPEIEIPEVLWQGERARDIPPELFEADALVKTNHGAGTNILLRDTDLSPKQIADYIDRKMRKPYGWASGQWGYHNIPRRVFVERRVDAPELAEVKVYIFNRHVSRVLHIVDRFGATRGDVWHDDGSGLRRSDEVYHRGETGPGLPLPASSEQAIAVARLLGEQFDSIRVDFMTDGTRLWFGEITVYPLGGAVAFTGHKTDATENRYWDLRRSWFMRTPQNGWREAYRQALGRSLAEAYRARSTADASEAGGL
ncbi:hypothetical protein KUV47_01340 [Vannielia litorea]|uniref:ATP-grasp fold amidoligase family protein n=1 Tax=Vannielia litorea TaxID=1217970 RepID=UPI001C97DA7E|nr:ATP-grasp fold amidoligase family protein [Vannielia litorea]MBY6151841.1 hypothetical protein [Vannielia litorea]